MYKILKIALPVPINKYFTYWTDDYADTNLVGMRVIVPFGSRNLTGIIIEEDFSEDINSLKPIFQLQDTEPTFSPIMLEFTKWISEYYFCSHGETLKAAAPPSFYQTIVNKIKIFDFVSEQDIINISRKAPKRAKILQELFECGTALNIRTLEKRLNIKINPKDLEIMINAELIQLVTTTGGDNKPKLQKAIKLNSIFLDDFSALKEIMQESDKKAPKQSELISFLLINSKKENQFTFKELNKLGYSTPIINALASKDIIEIIEIEKKIEKADEFDLSTRNEFELPLSNQQFTAYSDIKSYIEDSLFNVFLLHGVTGSGKTLVYIHAIAKCIESGKTALLLVPEISLTPQLIDRFQRVFPNKIAVLHSRMSDIERNFNWQKITNNECDLVIGARSGLFAPLNNLGIIIVDEEHESSYKQDNPAPRYHARDSAIMLAKLSECPVILGSATPSIESIYNCETGKYTLLEITERADNAKLPKIMAIDLNNSRKNGQMNGNFSNYLIDAIINRINKKEGVILFQNRRGYSNLLFCSNCGHTYMCPNCDITLTYHKSHFHLRCHYCGYTHKAQNSCPQCNHPEMDRIGSGTQKIEEELNQILESRSVKANIERFDWDTTSRKGAYKRILGDFIDEKIDILVGTQMLAKGLDLRRVTLVGVINADSHLLFPDFRASERTFQLLTQVGGRAGRAENNPGEVIIQTSRPSNYAIKYAILGDFHNFIQTELDNRLDAEYPPYSRFVTIEVSSLKENLAIDHARLIADLLKKEKSHLNILGPTVPDIYRLRGRYRLFIIIKSQKSRDKSGEKMRNIIKRAVDEYSQTTSSSAVQVKIDVDSYSSIK